VDIGLLDVSSCDVR